MLRDVMQAYETLSNDSYRQTYDRQINKGFFIFRKIDDSINHKSCTFIAPGFEACKYDNFGTKIQYENI
jgi:DnaJ-class molecular chaperone